MKLTKTFSISFLSRKSKADPKLGINYARISVDNTRVEYSIKRKVPFESWDQKGGRCTAQDQQSKIINQYLTQANSEIFNCYDELRKEGVLITADAIKARWLGEDSSGRYSSVFEYEDQASSLVGQQLLVISPSARDTTFVSFVGESL